MARKKKEKDIEADERIDVRKKEASTTKVYTEKSEGIILKDGNQEGLSAIVKFSEEVKVKQDHDANLESIGFKGILNIENPSTIDRLWDIDILLGNVEKVDIESSEIKIQELGITDVDNTDSREFQITGETQNLLIVKEFINTLPTAEDILNINDIESYILKLKDEISGVEVEEIEEEEEEDEVERVEEEADDILRETDEVLEETKDDLDEELEEEEDDEDLADDGGVEAEELPIETYGISINKLSKVTFAIGMYSLFEKTISEIKVLKNIPSEFNNIEIIEPSMGSAKLEDNQIIWTIDQLEPERITVLKFKADVQVETLDPVNTGTIEVTYNAKSSFTACLEEGICIEKFDAFTNNKFYIDMIEKDEEPGKWDCNLVFENPSEFNLELYNADVYDPENPDEKLVSIDEDNPPILPAGAEWHSTPWEYESEDYPTFRKELEFRVSSDIQTDVIGSIAISDVELVLASITGEISYKIEDLPVEMETEEENVINIPSYRDTSIIATLKVVNDGSAPLNEIRTTQKGFTEIFQPPNLEDPEEPDEIKLLWDGKEIELDKDSIIIEDNTVQIVLKNLKDTENGMLEPNSYIEVIYPINVENPSRDLEFETDVVYNANTYPIGPELEYIPTPDEVPIIKVLHIRRKYRVGKEIIPVGEIGNYRIRLYYENVGELPLINFVLIDKVPDNFEYSEFTMEPEITDEVGTDTLKWAIESLKEGDLLEITYEIKGSGEYHPSDAQLAF
jgi:hypothetical protein